MMNNTNLDPVIVERETVNSHVAPSPWYRRVSWGAILAGVVVALLSHFALQILGVAIGVGVLEPGEDMLGPEFGTAVVMWLAASTLLSLFAGGLVTGKLSGTTDEVDGVLHGIVMMGVVTFIIFYVLTSSISATVSGVSSVIGEGLSFVTATAEDVSPAIADAINLRDTTLENIRAEADEILAEDASFTSLRIALDDYLLSAEPSTEARQAAITALASQTTLTEEEAAQRLDRWQTDIRTTIDRFETQAQVVANDIADVVSATAGVIFAILVAGIFAAGAGGYVAVSSADDTPRNRTEQTVVRRRPAEVTG